MKRELLRAPVALFVRLRNHAGSEASVGREDTEVASAIDVGRPHQRQELGNEIVRSEDDAASTVLPRPAQAIDDSAI